MTEEFNKQEIEAIERLARGVDGPVIRRYFRRVLESCRLTDEPCALQRHEGARILARDFLVHMDRGLENDRADESILTRSGQPIPIAGTRAERRRALWIAERDDPGGPDAA